MTYRKKLIEVSLPLEAINEESAREKSIRHGHPSTLHLWWARRPLAACRAVLWSSLVDDPSEYMPDEKSANDERDRLFSILEKLVKWENINNDTVLDAARLEIARSVARDLGCDTPIGKQAVSEFLITKAPPVLDPFAGGGSIPLEAQRLGLRAYASDLNPVAVLINKALIEIPSMFDRMPPVHPPTSGQRQDSFIKKEWNGVDGLAEDVRYYGKWVRDEAEKSIGYLYPKVKISDEMLIDRPDLKLYGLHAGEELTVIAYLWARTVKCPNPACGCQMPLVRSFALSIAKSKKTWIEPQVSKDNGQSQISFCIKSGSTMPATDGTVGRSGAKCLCCGIPVPLDYIRSEGKQKKIGYSPIVVITEGKRSRIYIEPEFVDFPTVPSSDFLDDMNTSNISGYLNPPIYGYDTFGEWFIARQRYALETFANLINVAKLKCYEDSDKKDYSDSLAVYLTLAVGRLSNRLSSFAIWNTTGEKIEQTFSEQGVGMTWDFAEVNPFSNSTGSWEGSLEWIPKCLETLPNAPGNVVKRDAVEEFSEPSMPLICTDPPYYSSITYADFADFFYGTFRHILKNTFPDLFATLATPKENEIVAAWHRFGGSREAAGRHFRDRLQLAMNVLVKHSYPNGPFTVFYAFKEKEFDGNEGYLTAWESILSVLINSGLEIENTWPLRTERTTGRKADKNVLATSIVLVCRAKDKNRPTISRREFIRLLKQELPLSIRILQSSYIAPIDLAQAAIGPGMSVYSRYANVLESDGSTMRIQSALALINQNLDEVLAEQEGEYDRDTRWALAWFEQYGHEQGLFGVAETLSKAKNTSIEGLTLSGFVEAHSGKVRLLRRDELDKDWDPSKDKRLTAWEAVQYLIRALDELGEQGAGTILGRLGPISETARDLAYRLYTICERKNWAQEALAYNMLVVAWPRIKEQSGKGNRQEKLL